MAPKFPIKVRVRDSGEIYICKSIEEMQFHFERIDIENDEFEAWDANGNPLSMSVQAPAIWLVLKLRGEANASNARPEQSK